MSVEIRDRITSFALKASEKELLQKVCEEKSIRMSDYIRNVVMKQAEKDSK